MFIWRVERGKGSIFCDWEVSQIHKLNDNVVGFTKNKFQQSYLWMFKFTNVDTLLVFWMWRGADGMELSFLQTDCREERDGKVERWAVRRLGMMHSMILEVKLRLEIEWWLDKSWKGKLYFALMKYTPFYLKFYCLISETYEHNDKLEANRYRRFEFLGITLA